MCRPQRLAKGLRRRQPRGQEAHLHRLPSASLGVVLAEVARGHFTGYRRASLPRLATRRSRWRPPRAQRAATVHIPRLPSVFLVKDAVGHASARVLGYTNLYVVVDTAASAGLSRLTTGLCADAVPEKPDIVPYVAALLAKGHCTHRLARPVTWSTIADFTRVAAIPIVPKEVHLVGPAGALNAVPQPALERVVASLTCPIIDKVMLGSHTDAARDVWALRRCCPLGLLRTGRMTRDPAGSGTWYHALAGDA